MTGISKQRGINAALKGFSGVNVYGLTNGIVVNGIAIKRNTNLSLVLVSQIGAAVGSPIFFSVSPIVEHSIDGVNNWESFKIGENLVTDNKIALTNIDLSTAFKFIRLSTVAIFSGGVTPSIDVSIAGIFGGSNKNPP